MSEEKIKKMNEKGQTLLFVVVAVTIALAVGVAVSTRTLSSLKRVSRTDTSSRIIAVAEGGIENLLNQNYSKLDLAMDPNDANCQEISAKFDTIENKCVYAFSGVEPEPPCVCSTWAMGECGVLGCSLSERSQHRTCNPTGCDLTNQCVSDPSCEPSCVCSTWAMGECGVLGCSPEQRYFRRTCNPTGCDIVKECKYDPSCSGGPVIMGVSDDLISSRAVVTVEKFSTNEEGGGYSFNLEPGSVKEIVLKDYGGTKVKVCWVNPESAIYYFSYNTVGGVKRGGAYPSGLSLIEINSGFDQVGGESGFAGCKEITLIPTGTLYGLRIRVLYNPSKVVVFPVGSGIDLPDQGYKLTSKGEITSDTGEMQAATVIVYKSYPYASAIFDYGIYTTQTLQ